MRKIIYILTLKPLLQATPTLHEPKQVHTEISPKILTAQETGIFSDNELTKFWNRVLFTKHSLTALGLLEKAVSYDFPATSLKTYVNRNLFLGNLKKTPIDL